MLHVYSVQWNAGTGNTDTLHPNSCFSSFSIPASKIKFLLLHVRRILLSGDIIEFVKITNLSFTVDE